MRRRTLVILTSVLVLGAAGVPLVAFVIVPQFVRSTLAEAPLDAGAVTVRSGELVKISVADYGTGTIRIARTGTAQTVRFENVDIAGAPDVYVYLSDRTDGTPGSFTDLGRLKATNGSFSYAIPESVDLAAVRSVVLWCRQFSVTITYAVLR